MEIKLLGMYLKQLLLSLLLIYTLFSLSCKKDEDSVPPTINISKPSANSTHNTFDTGKFIYTSEGHNFKDYSDYKYEGPVFYLSLSYTINEYRPKRSKNNPDMNFDSGFDQ